MRIETVLKDSFVVVGKEGSTSDGDGFIQRLWSEANAHLGKSRTWSKKMETGIRLAFGERCLTRHIPLCRGRTTSKKAFILRERNVWMMHRLPPGG